ncbi:MULTISPECIES: serine/threonine-protein kinase [Cellvibrio]|uniref:Serine/threonine-protein kinase n=1 Tax=Cellvibrio fibrivorans TaxID=126350 RepID=A0ABU1UY53_9GAMM|nr:serine/threonine-protein kinase [Cellvibrio fibrivorans]MDR7090085.1 serine/threonine-protein kinase [Cellvibrio fibrivorans]
MQTIPGYHIKTLIGEGGMAKVYLAVQKSLDRPVAIKVLDASLNQDPIIQQQFEQESTLVARLSHPNIIQIIDKGISEQQLPYFVMPYVKSVSLETVLPRKDISLTRKLNILIQLCSALGYAHRNGVVHRDIKPANILVDYDGHAYLVDFGIAGYFTANKGAANASSETTDPDQERIMGTGAYMAPEQHNGTSHTNQLSDIYSLGVLMHELIFGVVPVLANEQTYAEQLTDKHQMTAALRPLINRCIEANPNQRPTSVDEIRQQLLLISQGRHLQGNRWGNESTRDNIPPNYTLLDVLKENPFGATYLVNDPNRQRFLVIKKQNLDHLGNAPQYAAKLTQVQHPHIARIFGTGKNPRVFISAMEYLPGGSLQERLTQSLSLGQCLTIAQQLCNSLACAHSYGIVHGNLRPSNVLFAEKNHLKLSDFGFPAHSYGDGTHWYQPANEPASTGADVYALGAILFQLFTGKLPVPDLWGWKNAWRLRKAPAKVRRLILQIIHLNPRKRIASAELAGAAFNQAQGEQKTQVLEKMVGI